MKNIGLNSRKGFTLIEILIVVAIIGILASVVIVGLGPAQKKGRDARRISDMRSAQTGLELFYGKFGHYPGGAVVTGEPATCPTAAAGAGGNWANLQTCLTTAGLGMQTLPNDPTSSKNYYYGSDGTTYVIGATLEDISAAAFAGSLTVTTLGVSCKLPTATVPGIYCLSL